MPTEIRAICETDHDLWLPLWQGYQRFYKTDISAKTTAITWQRFLDPAEPQYCALAWQDDQAIGMVHWIYHRSCWTVGDYCYLQDLYVDDTRRGTGAGRKLIEHVYADAAIKNAARVYWLTQEDNVTAMQLYDRIADRPGFTQYRKML
ncbi:GNAT family N-acetyltransferase [Thalassospira alkalitolerans]|uniref:GNAT family acetyltransferase n=1 Tax=Thalassospira alkalitolerans TaxID=1293890 RepID=A0A1Y2L899_9PROT|nr:GNAT family N-acetyltransferase [Thalassospira alkalitolerans]OSQ46238.1 GNAT family acetyltransferase [Thalassospira alkalitolerans]